MVTLPAAATRVRLRAGHHVLRTMPDGSTKHATVYFRRGLLAYLSQEGQDCSLLWPAESKRERFLRLLQRGNAPDTVAKVTELLLEDGRAVR